MQLKAERKKLKNKVYVLTAGAPPPSIIFKKMKNLGFEVMHVYGLTETYGHITQCAWNDEWNNLDEEKQNEIKARQGVRYPNTEGVDNYGSGNHEISSIEMEKQWAKL